jgi:acyl-CoA reductase-like NAD-dependent aldehyde dehydrogenase
VSRPSIAGQARTEDDGLPLLIGGEPVFTGRWIEREDPACPSELAGRVAAGDATHADRAVRAAAEAAAGWAATPVAERTSALERAASRLEALADELAPSLCRELGKVLDDCRGELTFSAMYLRDVARRAPALCAPTVEDDELGRLELVPEPHGVVAAVTPWNAPLILTVLKAAPALATGNTLVVKPSPLAPLTVTRLLAELAAEVPAGVVNVVHGGAEVGAALTSHPLVDKVAFTGGLATGQAIMRNAAGSVKPLVLELGGNDAAILLDDADLDDAAVERLVHASFLTSGQVCMAAKRVYVHRSRYDELLDRYERIARSALVLGHPAAVGTTVGPLVSREAVARVEALVDGAAARGAEVRPLGTVADARVVGEGYFARPSLVLGAADDDPIVVEEQFGPTVPVLPFDDVDEVVRRANASELALASSVWSGDEDRALSVARRLRAGTTFVNTHNRSGMSLRAPFGGRKLSGFGKEYGDAGVREYLVTHAINAPAAFRPGAGAAGSGAAYPGG